MPRYMVERSFPEGLGLAPNEKGAEVCAAVNATNMEKGVSWVHSYVTPDRKKTYCVYDGPTPEAIREVAKANSLPIDRITEVRVLDPYFHR
ncbi:MAG TPA: DUF4242 domain-containing protein [Usitatibacter sp.]|nr:DUF4242 domain-containing protein [Usitatibacter sp.]